MFQLILILILGTIGKDPKVYYNNLHVSVVEQLLCVKKKAQTRVGVLTKVSIDHTNHRANLAANIVFMKVPLKATGYPT